MFAKHLLVAHSAPLLSVLISPSKPKQLELLMPSVDHMSLRACFEAGRQLERTTTLAFLLRSPEGAALIRWRHDLLQHQTVILSGTDPTAERDGISVVYWSRVLDTPFAHVVVANSRALSTTDDAVAVADVVAQRLQLDKGSVMIRRDPWFWAESCNPLSLPIHWQLRPPAVENVKRNTYYCRFTGGVVEGCVMLR